MPAREHFLTLTRWRCMKQQKRKGHKPTLPSNKGCTNNNAERILGPRTTCRITYGTSLSPHHLLLKIKPHKTAISPLQPTIYIYVCARVCAYVYFSSANWTPATNLYLMQLQVFSKKHIDSNFLTHSRRLIFCWRINFSLFSDDFFSHLF